MEDNYRIALSGHASKWIDLYSENEGLKREFCIKILGCYSWSYAQWYDNFQYGRWIMQQDYNQTVDFIRSFQNI